MLPSRLPTGQCSFLGDALRARAPSPSSKRAPQQPLAGRRGTDAALLQQQTAFDSLRRGVPLLRRGGTVEAGPEASYRQEGFRCRRVGKMLCRARSTHLGRRVVELPRGCSASAIASRQPAVSLRCDRPDRVAPGHDPLVDTPRSSLLRVMARLRRPIRVRAGLRVSAWETGDETFRSVVSRHTR